MVMIVIFRYLGENPELNALLKMPSICYCQCEMASRKNQRTLDTSLPGLQMIDELWLETYSGCGVKFLDKISAEMEI